MYNEYPEVAYTSETGLLRRVFAWMALGLALTGLVAYFIASSPAAITFIFSHQWLIWVLLIVELGLVMGLSFGINKMSFPTAFAVFLTYAFLNGVTLSSIFLIYTFSSIALAFFVSSAMFGVMAGYGYMTNADLSSMGSILLMILWGLIIAMIVNIFLKSSQFEFLISIVGVILFALLTAHDTQRIKLLLSQVGTDSENVKKASVIGALQLYLDFINLFLFLLRFMGKRRN